MKNNWQHLKLAEVVNIIGGGTPKRSMEEYWGGDIHWLSVKDFNNDYRMVSQSEETITELGLQKSSTKLLSEGQIIISARGTVGELAQVTKPMAFNQSCYGIDAKPEYAINDFVYYLLKNSISNIQRVTHGAVFDTITRDTFNFIEVLLPTLPEQKAIAHILGTLDDKIELNRQMNETLEEMAQTLFKSWFVDFDPVIDNALLAGKVIPEPLKERAELRQAQLDSGKANTNSEINELFPSEFEFTEELGWIPKGWEPVQVHEIADVVKGRSYKSSELEPSETALVTLKSFKRGGGYRLDGLKEYTGKYREDQEVFAGDLVIAYTDVTQAADVIGKPAMVIDDVRYKHLVISLDVAVVRPYQDKLKYYLYGIAQTQAFQNHTLAHSTGTTVLHLSKDAVPSYFLALPSEDLLNFYTDFAKPIFDKVNEGIGEMSNLEKLRDTLLPKLMSGELRIADAEKLVAEII
ncbi:restriction endonuclease subunit S [Psychrobacter celer]|uniref:restriction endonuclease subunit S n=1 Tax=Psychrobacter celer TaxID=306572 RepID=UPI003FD33922